MRSSLIAAIALLPAPAARAQQFQWPARQVTLEPAGAPLPGEFTLVAGAVLWPDGRMLVAEGSASQVTLYDASGRKRWTRGRSGDGPGEYRRIASVARCANGNIGVFDMGTLRFTLLGADSGRVMHTRLEPGATQGEVPWCRDSTYFVAAVRSLSITKPPKPGERFNQLTTLRGFGARADTLATGATEMLMTSSAFTDLDLGERAVVSAGGSAIFLCQTGSGRCTVSSPASSGAQAFTLALPREPVTAEQWKHATEERVAGMVGPETARQQLARITAEIPKPDRFGAFHTVRADAADRLWVRTYRGYGGAQATWLIVSRTGQPLATASLPAAAEVLAIGEGTLIARVMTEDGEPQVRRYRFPRL